MLNEKEKFIIELTTSNMHLATEEGRAEIEHYLAADEWERAYEVLILELIEKQTKPKDFDKEEWKKILVDFEIDKHCHDESLMKKFDEWADS